jgi:NTP pyrophosphatase (non-canonical NTP hydrolase)
MTSIENTSRSVPTEYQQQAARTESPENVATNRIHASAGMSTRLLHAQLGLSSEVGELAGAIKKWLYYGRDIDLTNVKEELGDLMWYIALACNATGISLADVMESNIRKLQARYPDKFTEEAAADENRDKDKEKEALSQSKYPIDFHPSHPFGTGSICPVCYTVKGSIKSFRECIPVATSGS